MRVSARALLCLTCALTPVRLRGEPAAPPEAPGAVTGEAPSAARISPAAATAELLKVVPADMAACLILEDVAGHYHRLTESDFFAKLDAFPLVQKWKTSGEYRGLRQVQLLGPLYFGMSVADLRDRIFGLSAVLAFRPGKSADEPDLGLLVTRARDEETLAKLFANLTREVQGRQVRALTYRDTAYWRREEAGGRVDYLVRLGAIAGLCGEEAAVRAIIDAARDGRSLANVPVFNEMRQALPADCLARFLLNPRVFDDRVAAALANGTAEDQAWSRLLGAFWKSMRWTAVSLRFADGAQLGWHFATNEDVAGAARAWEESRAGRTEFWKSVPADALAALSGAVDFPNAGRFFRATVPERSRNSLDLGAKLFEQLLVGHDAANDLLPRLGPRFGIILTEGEDGFQPRLYGVIPLKDKPASDVGMLPLSIAAEHAAQAMMVFFGAEHNQVTSDSVLVRMEVSNGARIHYLSGSTVFPAWFEPAFAVHGGHLVLGSSPAAVLAGATAPPHCWADSPFARRLASNLPDAYVPSAYLNIAQLRDYAQRYRGDLAAQLARWTGVDEPTWNQRLDLLLAVAGLVDHAAIGGYAEGDIKHWILSVYPAAPIAAPAPDEGEATGERAASTPNAR